uniref:Satellite-encoded protein n=1 Tax=Arabis mosaic virus TaxID=12271 RepID=Q2F805_ARMV|nr:satellite-encoded protein [Arabis mosaic virus]
MELSYYRTPRTSVEVLVPSEYAKLFTQKQLQRMLILACKHRAREAAKAVSKRTSRDRNGSKRMGQGLPAETPKVSLGHVKQCDGGASLTPVKSKRALRRKRRRAAKKAKAKTGTIPVKKAGPTTQMEVPKGRASYLSSLLSGVSSVKSKWDDEHIPKTKNAPGTSEGKFTLTSMTPAECRGLTDAKYHPLTGSHLGAHGFCTFSRQGCGACSICAGKYTHALWNKRFDLVNSSRVIKVESMNLPESDEMASASATEPPGFWVPEEIQAPRENARPIKRCDVATLARVTPVVRMLRQVDPTLVDHRLLWEAAFRTVFPQRKCAYPFGCFGELDGMGKPGNWASFVYSLA